MYHKLVVLLIQHRLIKKFNCKDGFKKLIMKIDKKG